MLQDEIASGRIRVSPPLNDAERAFLHEVADGEGTLRGTPTGRGDASVPFARLAWRPCQQGCCLTWTTQEASRHLAATLRFVVDHLLRPGARAARHRRFPGFTCDHVLDGVAVVQRYDDPRPYVVRVRANQVEELQVEPGCVPPRSERAAGRTWPANVVALRPRHWTRHGDASPRR